MFLGMQDFDFAQVYSNLPKSFTTLLPKFFLGYAAASPAPTAALLGSYIKFM